MLKLYGCGSPNVFKVQLMLAELGLEYEFEATPLYGEALSSPSFRRLNPNGKLPVLVDDGESVFESGAILLHLAEKTGRLLAADGVARSQALQWLMWQVAGVGPMFGQALHFRFIAPAATNYARARYDREVRRLYGVAEARLASSPWFAGVDYSIADIAVFPWLGRYARTLDVDIQAYPAVLDWIARIEARPATQAAAPLAKQLFKADLAAQATASQADLDRFFGRQR